MFSNLDQTDEKLEKAVARHHQLHQLYPGAGHERNRVLAERQLLAVRAKAAALEWIQQPSSEYVPQD